LSSSREGALRKWRKGLPKSKPNRAPLAVAKARHFRHNIHGALKALLCVGFEIDFYI
jgi:hypothetical protein